MNVANMINGEAFIKHYGRKGMHWGVRTKVSSTIATKRAVKSKTAHLSNDELRKVVDRMRLEQQYGEMNNPKVAKGKKYSQNLLERFGSKAAEAVGTAVIGIVMGKIISDRSKPKIGIAKGDVIRIGPRKGG